MNRRPPAENTARVLGLAVAFFGLLAALGFASGLYVRLGAELVLSLAAFGLAFALLTWYLDPAVRGLVSRALAFRSRAGKSPAATRAAT